MLPKSLTKRTALFASMWLVIVAATIVPADRRDGRPTTSGSPDPGSLLSFETPCPPLSAPSPPPSTSRLCGRAGRCLRSSKVTMTVRMS